MRIGIFTRTFRPNVGGLERLAEILATEFAKKGHIVSVITDVEVDSNECDFGLLYRVVRTKRILDRFHAFREMDIVLFFNLSLVGLLSLIPSLKPAVMVHQADQPVRFNTTQVPASVAFLGSLTVVEILLPHLAYRPHQLVIPRQALVPLLL